jgi:hypothetical protein
MAVFHPSKLQCACGAEFVAALARSVNAGRAPELRAAILKGAFHTFPCPRCQAPVKVERPFLYTDLRRNCLFHVKPRSCRHQFKELSKDLDRALASFPQATLPRGKLQLRVVFGLDELREKLVAQDLGIDDRLVELLKVLVIYEHPVLTRRARLRLTLEQASDSDLEFAAAYEHSPERFRISVPRAIASKLAEHPDEVRSWVDKAHGAQSVFNEPDHWVNLWRWSPQPSALDVLRSYAELARSGAELDTGSQDFERMLRDLPRGTHLPPWAKRDLRSIEEYVKEHAPGELEDALFEIRFGFKLEDDWARNDQPDDIATLWQLLDDLPDTNVEGNTRIREILLGAGGGGTYNPTTNDIEIGADLQPGEQRFQDVVRHEVGHAVHEMLDVKVNSWLASLGWQTFDDTDAGIDGWVNLMGGWGRLTTSQKKNVRQYLQTALGPGSTFNAGQAPSVPADDPWNQKDFGPRLAYEQSQSAWYRYNKTWHRANGKAFFLNYWYRTFIAVDESVLALVAQMPSDYAAMSHFEFFAELYALYHDVDNPSRAQISAEMATWLAQNTAAEKLPAAMPAMLATKMDFETITRPQRRKRSAAAKPKARSSAAKRKTARKTPRKKPRRSVR